MSSIENVVEVEQMIQALTSSEPVVLDPESVQEKLGEAMRQVVDAAVILTRSAPYGIMPDPAHMGVLRHAVKKLDLASAEANITAALMKLAEQADDAPKDIVTEGLAQDDPGPDPDPRDTQGDLQFHNDREEGRA